MIALCVTLVGVACVKPPPVEQGPPDRYTFGLSDNCLEDYVVVFLRGSSQPDEIAAQPETRRFFQVMDRVFLNQIQLGYVSVEYPATGGMDSNIEALGNGATAGTYHESRKAGSAAAAKFLNERAAHCQAVEPEDQREGFIVAGYSQGAHAMREALFMLDPEASRRVHYVALFGDTTFNGAAATARGTFLPGAKGIFGAPDPQVPEQLAAVTESYCDLRDFNCSAGPTVAGAVAGQLVDLAGKLVGQASAHGMYPFEEMYQSATAFLTSRQIPFFGPSNGNVSMIPGEYAGYYEGLARCGSDQQSQVLGLDVDIRSSGIEHLASETVEHLAGAMRYYDVTNAKDESERRYLGSAELEGTGGKGYVRLGHKKWTEGENLNPRDLTLETTVQLLEPGPVDEAAKRYFISSPQSGVDGCSYHFDKVR